MFVGGVELALFLYAAGALSGTGPHASRLGPQNG
jgi:hypothetical protein